VTPGPSPTRRMMCLVEFPKSEPQVRSGLRWCSILIYTIAFKWSFLSHAEFFSLQRSWRAAAGPQPNNSQKETEGTEQSFIRCPPLPLLPAVQILRA